MHIKGLVDEDFVNFKQPSMYICMCACDFKCETESGTSCCQNSSLAKARTIRVPDDNIIRRYIKNNITKAIVFGGLEPFEQFEELLSFISKLRFSYRCDDTVVIYSGFNKTEILSQTEELKQFKNIIVKFGRFIPNADERYDDVLGVTLSSSNQYAEVICR